MKIQVYALIAFACFYLGSCVYLRNEVGSEFRVNTYYDNDQTLGRVSELNNGEFVAVWKSLNQAGTGWDVYSKVFDESGTAATVETRVNTYLADSSQYNPQVAGLTTSGRIVVVWIATNRDSGGAAIYGKILSHDLITLKSEFRVNTMTTNDQTNPTLTSLTNGGFVVVWQSYSQDGNGNGIYMHVYDSTGQTVRGETQVNSVTFGDQNLPSVDSLANGGFVAVWSSPDISGFGIYMRIYDETGNVIKDETRVNTYTTSNQYISDVAGLSNGGFVVAWRSENQDGSSFGVFFQVYDSSGNKVGSEQQANSYYSNAQQRVQVEGLPNGLFVVVWDSYGNTPTSLTDVYARVYDNDGNSMEDEFLVNPESDRANVAQYNPYVSVVGTDRFVITWTEDPSKSDMDVMAQIYRVGLETAPTVSNPIPDQEATFGQAFTFTFAENTFDSPYAMTYSAKLSNGDALSTTWIALSGRTFSGTPDNAHGETHVITVTATNTLSETVTDTFTITVPSNFLTTNVIVDDVSDVPGTLIQLQFAENTFVNDAGKSADIVYDLKQLTEDPENAGQFTVEGDALPSWITWYPEIRMIFGVMPRAYQVNHLRLKARDTVQNKPGEQDFTIEIQSPFPYVNRPLEDHSFGALTDTFGFPSDSFLEGYYDPVADPSHNSALTHVATLIDENDQTLPSWLTFDPVTLQFTIAIVDDSYVCDNSWGITVTATNTRGYEVSDSFLLNSLKAEPTLDALIGDQDLLCDSVVSVDLNGHFSDPDGHALSYQVVLLGNPGEHALPAWLSFDAATLLLTGTVPSSMRNQIISLRAIAHDVCGQPVSDTFNIIPSSSRPTLDQTKYTQVQGSIPGALPIDTAISIGFDANLFLMGCCDGSADLQYGITLAPSGDPLPATLTANSATNTLTGKIPYAYTDETITFMITAESDCSETVDVAYFSFDVSHEIYDLTDYYNAGESITDQVIPANQMTEYANIFDTASFPAGLTLSSTLKDGTALPAEWITFDATEAKWQFTASALQCETVAIIITAQDASGKTSNTLEFHVTVVNASPQPTTAMVHLSNLQSGMSFDYDFSGFQDQESNTIVYQAQLINGDSLDTLPWLSMKANGLGIEGTATEDCYLETHLRINVRDQCSEFGNGQGLILISSNKNYVLRNPATDLNPMEFNYDAIFSQTLPSDLFKLTNPTANADITYSATLLNGDPLPAWIAFDTNTLALSGLKSEDDLSICSENFDLQIVGTSSECGHAETEELGILVTRERPIMTSALVDQQINYVDYDTTFEYDVLDADWQTSWSTLTYTIEITDEGSVTADTSADFPTGIQITGDTVLTCDMSQIKLLPSSIWNFVVRAEDTCGNELVDAFNLEWTNLPPQQDITIGNVGTIGWVIGQPSEFCLTSKNYFSDPEGQPISFGVPTLTGGDPIPAWMSWDALTSTISGTPPGEVADTEVEIMIQVFDDLSNKLTTYFTISFENQPPYVNNQFELTEDEQPKRGEAWQYTFPADTFADPEGDALTYTYDIIYTDVADYSWLQFDATTRTFSGNVPVGENACEQAYEIQLKAQDIAGNEAIYDFYFEAINILPEFTETPDDVQLRMSQTYTDLPANLIYEKFDFDGIHFDYQFYYTDHSSAYPIVDNAISWLHVDKAAQTFSGTVPPDYPVNSRIKLKWIIYDECGKGDIIRQTLNIVAPQISNLRTNSDVSSSHSLTSSSSRNLQISFVLIITFLLTFFRMII
ncbi:dystroglycan-related [Anaeramoeba flamelloides]|uniref:Dystroglycan-related n=1 Tax=Anaeramoeba flamelloides TaxID=1746091 RepID=A0ABQ8Z3K5_9EUKA|nr:dystroglycan-related [Anaeramoeba flamelloides]